jgi:hypothetical protein
MTDLDRALSVARTWENEAIAKGTRSTAASRRRLATIITALTEAQERERRVRTLANQVPARTSLGWLAEKFLVALGEPRSGNQPEVHMQWKGTDSLPRLPVFFVPTLTMPMSSTSTVTCSVGSLVHAAAPPGASVNHLSNPNRLSKPPNSRQQPASLSIL